VFDLDGDSSNQGGCYCTGHADACQSHVDKHSSNISRVKACLWSSSFICPIIQQYAHLHRYNFRRAGQQGPTRKLTAALKLMMTSVYRDGWRYLTWVETVFFPLTCSATSVCCGTATCITNPQQIKVVEFEQSNKVGRRARTSGGASRGSICDSWYLVTLSWLRHVGSVGCRKITKCGRLHAGKLVTVSIFETVLHASLPG